MKRLAILITTCAVLLSSPAVQGESHTRTALRLFQSGFDKYNKGHHAAALAEFLRSNELRADFQTMFNIGRCYAQLRRYDEAMTVFTRLLSDRKIPGFRASHLPHVRQEHDRLLKLVGQVTLLISVPEGVVRVNGRVVEVAPHKPLFLSAGTHHIDVRAEGYAMIHKSIVVRAETTQQVSLVLKPARRVGQLRVESNAKATRIKVDGRPVGQAPWQGEVAEGEHVVEAEAEARIKQVRTIRTPAGQQVVSTFHLQPRPTRFVLTVALNVPGAIYVDGKHMGDGLVWTGQVDTFAAKVKVHVESPEHLAWNGEVPVDPARPAIAKVMLVKSSRGPHPALFWTGVGLTGALAVSALTTGILTSLKHDEFSKMYRDDPEAGRVAEEGNTMSLATDVLLGTTVACAVATVLLFKYTEFSEHRSSGEVLVGMAPLEGGSAVALYGRF